MLLCRVGDNEVVHDATALVGEQRQRALWDGTLGSAGRAPGPAPGGTMGALCPCRAGCQVPLAPTSPPGHVALLAPYLARLQLGDVPHHQALQELDAVPAVHPSLEGAGGVR